MLNPFFLFFVFREISKAPAIFIKLKEIITRATLDGVKFTSKRRKKVSVNVIKVIEKIILSTIRSIPSRARASRELNLADP